jgi:hypothetical protein
MEYDDQLLYMDEYQQASKVFNEYIQRKPLSLLYPEPCYVLIPPGLDYYVPEIDGDDEPAEIEKK